MQFLWLPFSSLSNDIGYISLYIKTFSVKQKYQKPTNSLVDNDNQITNSRSVLKLWLPELLMCKFWDCSRTLLWAQLNIFLSLFVHHLRRNIFLWAKYPNSNHIFSSVDVKGLSDLIMVLQLISICLKLWI